MRRTVTFVAGAAAWTVAVWVATFWLTFPSDTLAERIRYEVPNVLGDAYSAEVGSVRPWWLGVSVNDVKLFRAEKPARVPHRPTSFEEEDPEEDGGEAAPAPTGPTLAALVSNARIRVSPWSLFRRAPYVAGSVTLTEGTLHYAVGTALDERGKIGLADLVLTGDAVPLADLFGLVPGLTASGTGAVDVAIDLHAGENGMRDASGSIEMSGSTLTLLTSEVELPSVGPLGMDIPIRELALKANVEAGKATISEGHIDSELLNVAITGDIMLREPLDRSTIDLKITLSKLGPALASYEMFLAAAKTSDGTYQYTCRGVVSRLSQYSCSAGREKVSSRATPSTAGGRPPVPLTERDPAADAERERRREELRERLRQRREERETDKPGGEDPPPPEDEEPDPGEEDLPPGIEPDDLPPEFDLEEPPPE